MTDRDNGGSAFPEHRFESYGNGAVRHTMHSGMTLRDWFAGQALMSVINKCAQDHLKEGESREQMFARKAYVVADAMLAARETQQ